MDINIFWYTDISQSQKIEKFKFRSGNLLKEKEDKFEDIL